MDRKILTVSIMTILVLLGVFWVIAVGVISGGINSDYQWTNITTNGSVVNWTGPNGFVGSTAGASPIWENITFALTLNHSTIGSANITNITINITGNGTAIGNLTIEDAINTTVGGYLQTFNTINLECKSTKGTAIFCVNMTGGVSNLSGNGTYRIWAGLNVAHGLSAEQKYSWKIDVADNDSNTSTRTLSYWGIDTLAPRLLEFNISAGNNEWSSSKSELNGTSTHTIKNDSAVTIKIKLNETNRGGDILLFWNTSGGTTTDFQNFTKYVAGNTANRNYSKTAGNGTWDINGDTTCSKTDDNSSGVPCLYTLSLAAGNFSLTDGKMVVFTVFINDSFNQTSIYNGFNVTVDGTIPGAGISVSKDSTTYTQGAVTVTCAPSDVTSEASTDQITLTKPNGEIITVIDEESHTFRNTDTGLAGKYTAKCKAKDAAGWTSGEVESSFNIYYKSGGGGASAPSKIADVDVSTETPGKSSGKQGESQTFTLDGVTTHRLTFLTISETTATILIESEPIEITLSVGASKEVTINGDKIKVTLDSIVNGKASVTIVNIAAVEEAEAGEEGVGEEGEITEETAGISTWLIVLIIIVIVVVLYFVMKGKKGKKGEVSFSRKDLK